MKQQTLLLLAHSAAPTSEADLVRWIEPATAKDYRRDVLVALHKERYVEYDRQAGVVHLTDRGNSYVEDNLMAYL